MRPGGEAVFVAKGLTKVYRMGEVEVHALRGRTRAHALPARAPRRSAREALIEGGVAEGEDVILYPTDVIADGVAVSAR